MTLEEIKAKSDTFFEWPNNKDRNYITYTSAMLFARDCCKDVEAANENLEKLCDKRQRTIDKQLQRHQEFTALHNEKLDRIAELEAAIVACLNENGHLADGENCTLICLKRAMPAWELE